MLLAYIKVKCYHYMAFAWSDQTSTLCILGKFLCFCYRLLKFGKKITFSNILSGTLSGCQTVWIQIRTDILSLLAWVETVCKGYQSTTKVAEKSPLARKVNHYENGRYIGLDTWQVLWQDFAYFCMSAHTFKMFFNIRRWPDEKGRRGQRNDRTSRCTHVQNVFQPICP